MINWFKKPMPLILVDLSVNKITEIEGKIPSITGLPITAALAAIEIRQETLLIQSKIPDYDDKIKQIESKYFTKSYHNKFTNNILDAKIKNKKLVLDLLIALIQMKR